MGLAHVPVSGHTQASGVNTASASTEGGFEQERFSPSWIMRAQEHTARG